MLLLLLIPISPARPLFLTSSLAKSSFHFISLAVTLSFPAQPSYISVSLFNPPFSSFSSPYILSSLTEPMKIIELIHFTSERELACRIYEISLRLVREYVISEYEVLLYELDYVFAYSFCF